MEAWRPRLASRTLLKHDPVRNQDMLLMPERVVRLNVSAAAILRLCDGSLTASEIAAELSKDYGEEGVHVDVLRFLDRVRFRRWLQ